MNTAKISDQRVFAVVIVVHGYMQSFCNTAEAAPPPLKRPIGRAAEDRISTRWGHAHGVGDPDSTHNNPEEVAAAAVGGYGVVGQG